MSKFFKSIGQGALIAALLIAGIFALGHGLGGFPPTASAETEDWAMHAEHTVSGSQTITNGVTPAVIDTGVSGQRCVIKSMYLTSETAGKVYFFSGSTTTGANQIGAFYLAANTPVQITTAMLRGGLGTDISSTAATPITAVGPGVLDYTIVVRNDTGIRNTK